MAAVAPAPDVIRFQVFDSIKTLVIDPTVSVFDVLETQSFDPDAHTFLDVVRWHLRSNPDDRGTVMRIGAFVIGTDVSLENPLRDCVRILDRRIDNLPVVIYLSHIRSHMVEVEYEKIRYALAANAADLPWPLWDKEDTDPINMQVLGSYDDFRASAVPLRAIPDKREDNSIRNLIGMRRGRHLKFVNMHALVASLAHGTRREPVFHTEIDRIELFKRHLEDAVQRSLSPPEDNPFVVLLPIIDLVTTSVDHRYGLALSTFEQRMKDQSLSEEARRSVVLQQEREVNFNQLKTRRFLIDRIRQFIRSNPDATIASVEAQSKHDYDTMAGPHSIDVSVALEDARAEHRLAAEAEDWHIDNRLIEMYKRAFLAGDQDARPNKHAIDLYAAIKVRRFSRLEIHGYAAMIDAVRAIHVQYNDQDTQAAREARRVAILAAIDVDYSVDAAARASGCRLADHMERQLR